MIRKAVLTVSLLCATATFGMGALSYCTTLGEYSWHDMQVAFRRGTLEYWHTTVTRERPRPLAVSFGGLAVERFSGGGYVCGGFRSWLRTGGARQYLWSVVVFVPLWMPTVLFAAYPAIALARSPGRRHRRRRKRGQCVKCGYDLTGNVSGVCSECGTAL